MTDIKLNAEDIVYSIYDRDELGDEIIKNFKCGNDEIDKKLYKTDNSYTTIVFVNDKENEVIAFASFCASAIVYKPYNSNLIMLPAAEINFFALDEKYQHLQFLSIKDERYTLGDKIFGDIISHLTEISTKIISFDYITLYAVNSAVSFYKRNLFSDFSEHMEPAKKRYFEGCTPMYIQL